MYLGEKVVSEKEYLSAMMRCGVVRGGGEGMKRGQRAVAGSEMNASMELTKLGNRRDAAAAESTHGPVKLHVTYAKPRLGRLSLRNISHSMLFPQLPLPPCLSVTLTYLEPASAPSPV